MVKESIVHSQLNTCGSAEGTPVCTVYGWRPGSVFLMAVEPIYGIVSYAFDLLPSIMIVLISLNVQIIYWHGSERWDHLWIFLSPRRLRTEASPSVSWCSVVMGFSLFVQRERTLPDLKTLIPKAHHWPRVSWYNCFPEHWNDTFMAGFFRRSLLLCHWNSAKLKPLALNCRRTMLFLMKCL